MPVQLEMKYTVTAVKAANLVTNSMSTAANNTGAIA